MHETTRLSICFRTRRPLPAGPSGEELSLILARNALVTRGGPSAPRPVAVPSRDTAERHPRILRGYRAQRGPADTNLLGSRYPARNALVWRRGWEAPQICGVQYSIPARFLIETTKQVK